MATSTGASHSSDAAATDTMLSLAQRLDLVESYALPRSSSHAATAVDTTAERDSLLARIRRLHQQVARVESRCPGLQSAVEK
jgi:hypothetical protein